MVMSLTTPKHPPQRTCIACGARRDKRALIRVEIGPDGVLSIGGSTRQQGRGAYLCPSRVCWEKGLKGARLEHALRAHMTDDNRAALLQYTSTLQEFESHGKNNAEQE